MRAPGPPLGHKYFNFFISVLNENLKFRKKFRKKMTMASNRLISDLGGRYDQEPIMSNNNWLQYITIGGLFKEFFMHFYGS